MNKKMVALVVAVVVNLLVLDGVVGWVITKTQNIQNTKVIAQYQAPVDLSEIRDQISEIKAEVVKVQSSRVAETLVPMPTPLRPSATPRASAGQARKTRTVQYVAVPGSGSSGSADWADLTGTEFYFSPEDYPGLVEVYFEANLRLYNGNGMAYVRLVDQTHGIGVQGSEVQTNSQAGGIIVSGKVNFWKGRNLIEVQARSQTADTAVYNSGRLRIVTQN